MNAASLRTYIQTELLNDEAFGIELDQDLLLTQTLDSLAVTRLVHHLETELDITIPPEDVTLENFRSLQQIVAYLETRASR